MGLKFKYILISGAILAVFLTLPLSHHHPSTIYDPNCFAGKMELALLAYSLTFLSLVLVALAAHPFVNLQNTTFLAVADFYHFFINRAPPSPFK